MTLLAEIVRRCDGRRFEQYVRDEVFEPLGMTDCWVGMPPERVAGYGERIGTMHVTAPGPAVPFDDLDAEVHLTRCVARGRGARPDAATGPSVRGAARAR